MCTFRDEINFKVATRCAPATEKRFVATDVADYRRRACHILQSDA